MKSATLPNLLGLMALVLIAGPFASAQDAGWYVGGNLGRSKAKLDDPRITSTLLGEGFTVQSLDDHDRDTGYKLYAGYAFNRYFAFEGGYFNLGSFNYTANTFPAGAQNGDLKVQGANLDAVLSLPFTHRFSAFARFGVNYADVKDSFHGTGQVNVLAPAVSKSSANYKFGGGLQYRFTRNVALRAEMERYHINDPVANKADLDLASLGLVVRFGRSRPAPAPQAAAYAPEAPPPPPPPEKAVVWTAPRTETYCSLLDLQFDINRDTIQDEDKEKLKVVGTFMTTYPGTTAVIEGHTDNVGTPEHNLKLSQSRAENVVTYLVTDLHIDARRLSAVGYGEAHPQVSNDTEEGKRRNRRIDAVISCATDIPGLSPASPRLTMAMVMEFDQNSAEIKPEYDPQLLSVATYLKANPRATATVEGHTANMKATPEKMLQVSLQRAQNVVDYLVTTCGIDRARLTAAGFGDDRRFAYNSSREGQAENRRVNIIFNYPKQ